MATMQDINAIYKNQLGRSADKSGLDYWTSQAKTKGLDYVRQAIGGSSEASLYGNRGAGLTVAKADQVDGLNYRNNAKRATQQARDKTDYGLLQRGMNQLVEAGNFTQVQGDQGDTLYRSATGGLYDINGQEVPTPTPSASRVPQTQVTREQTSRGQLDDMLASDSPLMQRAAMQGQQMANQRGLLNSSMAAGAAQGAMIDRAQPFAQQDAQTHYANSQANAGRSMQDYMSDKQHQQQRDLNQQGFGFDTQRMAQEFTYNSQLSSQEAEQSLNNLYATSTANAWGVMANNLTDLVGQSASAIQQIQMNPDITADNKASMIQQVLDMRNTDITFQQSLYENLGTYLANTGVFPSLA